MHSRREAHSSYFCRGWLPVAFVFGAPNIAELRQNTPVVGDTGRNLDIALLHLQAEQPALFTATDRYGYRITNVLREPLAAWTRRGQWQASAAKIRHPENVKRVLDDIEGCTHVILCGGIAQLFLDPIRERTKAVATVCHISNKGLNGTYLVDLPKGKDYCYQRREQRITQWVRAVVQQLSHPQSA